MTQNSSGFGFRSAPLTKAVKEGLPSYDERLESIKKLQTRPTLPSLISGPETPEVDTTIPLQQRLDQSEPGRYQVIDDRKVIQMQLDQQEEGRYQVLSERDETLLRNDPGLVDSNIPEQAAPEPKEREMRAYEPSFFEKILNIFPGKKDAAFVEYAAREVAKEEGKSVSQIYKEAGGERDVWNPEGRPPLQALSEGGKELAKQAPHIFPSAANVVLRTIRGGDDYPEESMLDRAIKATEVGQAGFQDPNYQSVQGVGESIGFSLSTIIPAAVAVAGGTAVAGPAGGAGAGMLTAGGLAYRATKDEFLDRAIESLNQKSEEIYGRPLNDDEWVEARKEFDAAATKYGAWEAVPEAVSSMIFIKAFSVPLKGMNRAAKLKDVANRAAQTQLSEQTTEAMTGLGQNRAELEAGLTDEELTLGDVIKSQVLNVGLTTAIMGGGAGGARALYDRTPMGKKASIEQDLAAELERNIEGGEFAQSAEEAAISSLDPDKTAEQMKADLPISKGPISAAANAGAIEEIDQVAEEVKIQQEQAKVQKPSTNRVRIKAAYGEIDGVIVPSDIGLRIKGDDGQIYDFESLDTPNVDFVSIDDQGNEYGSIKPMPTVDDAGAGILPKEQITDEVPSDIVSEMPDEQPGITEEPLEDRRDDIPSAVPVTYDESTLEFKRDGTPFASKAKADTAMKNRRLKGYESVEVEGGFALSPLKEDERIDQAAQEAATSPENDIPQPTEAQIEAGNYKKGHTNIQGLEISIENPKGSTRSGTDEKGESWSVDMQHHYGYIKRTEGADGEHVDVFIGESPESESIFVVDQVNPDGSFDEHKVMVGFNDRESAIEGYKSNYTDDWTVGPVTAMSMDEFKTWLKESDNTKPVSDMAKPTPDIEAKKEPELTPDEVKSEINKIGELVKARRDEDESKFDYIPPESLKDDLDYLTDEEKQKLHDLKLRLPSSGQEAADAKERIKQKIADRKSKTTLKEIPEQPDKDPFYFYSKKESNVSEYIKWISKNHEDSSYKAIAERISTLIPSGLNYKVYEQGQKMPGLLASGKAQAFFTQKRDNKTRKYSVGEIHVKGKTFISEDSREKAMLHETLHAVLQEKIEEGSLTETAKTNPQLKKNVSELFKLTNHVIESINEMTKKGEIPEEYKRAIGQLDQHEIITWGLTDNTMQELLKKIKYKSTSAWSEFVKIIGNILGIKKEDNTALGELIRITDNLLISEIKAEKKADVPKEPEAARKPKKEVKPKKVKKGAVTSPAILKFLGDIKVGDTVTISGDIGYSKSGQSYNIDNISNNGISVSTVDTGSGTVWSKSEITRASRGGVTLEKVEQKETEIQTLDEVKKAWTDSGIEHQISENDREINLSKIVVKPDERKTGKGSQAIESLVIYADSVNKRIVLSPSIDFGGTKSRLIKFYKRFGFVENKGRNKNFEIAEEMFREPIDSDMHTIAYHGTPHEFDEFSLDAMGTGEGAQAYGWGLYFASKKGVAEWYRDILSNQQQGVDARGTVDRYFEGIEFNDETRTQAITEFNERAQASQNNKFKDKMSDAILLLQSGYIPGGKLFQVDIPESDQLLDWDKPLSKQSESVREKLKDAFPSDPLNVDELSDTDIEQLILEADSNAEPEGLKRNELIELAEEVGVFELAADTDPNGNQIYKRLVGEHGSDKEASLYLNSIGIPGLQYFDGSSRGTDGDTRNYVIWDEKSVTVEAVSDEVRQAKEHSIDTKAAIGMPVEEVKSTLENSYVGDLVKKLIKSGQIVIVEDVSGMPTDYEKAGATTTPEGKIYINASRVVSKQNLVSVLLHEIFHVGTKKLKGTKQWNKLTKDLERTMRTLDRTTGAGNKFYKEAADRLRLAIRYGPNLSNKDRIEEFAAYAIEEYERAPVTVKNWVDKLLGHIKAWLLKRFGIQAGRVSPEQLRAIAVESLRGAVKDGIVKTPDSDQLEPGQLSVDKDYTEIQEDQLVEDATYEEFIEAVRKQESAEKLARRYPKKPQELTTVGGKIPRKGWTSATIAGRQGRPVILHRGAGKSLTPSDFAIENLGKASGHPSSGLGVWLTVDQRESKRYGNSEPFYLDIRNPKVFKDGNIPAFDSVKKANEYQEQLKRDGYDGIVHDMRGIGGTVHFVAFSPNQIISPEVKEKPKHSIGPTPGEPLFKDVSIDPGVDRGKSRRLFDKIIYQAQDKFNALRDVQKKAKVATESQDAYLAEELYHGRARKRLDIFEDNYVQPLLKLINDSGLSLEEVETWLHARHAEEANAHLKSINPGMEDNESLSGMSNEVANSILKEHSANKKLQEIGNMVNEINNSRLMILGYEDLVDQADIESIRKSYENYIPLHREEVEARMSPRGQGFNVKGKEVKRRVGSHKKVENILPHLISQYQSTVVRAEKARVHRALYKLAIQNPDKEFWQVDEAPVTRTVGKEGLVVQTVDPRFKEKDNVLTVKIKGKEYTITFNDKNEYAMRIASAMKNLDASNMNFGLQVMASINRLLSAVNTGYNPEFIISNAIRDMQTAIYNISDTDASNIAGKMVKDYPKALLGIRNALRGDGKSDWAKEFDEFEREGGRTGWMEHMDSVDDFRKRLVRDFNTMGKGKKAVTMRQLRKVFKTIEDYNNVVENAVRLSAYKNAKDAGLSKAKAASLAKNLTVNFNRKGAAGPAMNAAYLFYNASIQGSFRLVQAMTRSKRAQKLIVGTMVTAMVLDIVNRAMSDKDDDEVPYYDKIPEYIKERNLVIMLKGDNYASLPLPWGYNVFHVIGRTAGEASNKEGFKPLNGASNIAMSVFGAFNPISGGSFLQTLSPTILDPSVQMAENKSWSGQKLMPENMGFGPDKPDSQLYFSSVRSMSKDVAEKVNQITGGNRAKPGLIDVSPESIDLWIDFLTGGMGRFIANFADTGNRFFITGEDIERKNVPLLRKVYGKVSPRFDQAEFFDHSTEIEQLKAQLDEYEDDPEMLAIIESRNEKLMPLLGMNKQFKSKMSRIRKQSRRAEAAGDEEEVKAKKEEMQELYKIFNKEYRDAIKDSE